MRVTVLQSGIWQTNSSVISAGGAVLVIDPAYFPRELDAIAAAARAAGQVAAVAFTHGHWDHVMGHAALPEAPVWLSSVLDQAIATDDPRAAQHLADARDFDGRWYVPRPHGHRWPAARRAIADGEALALGPLTVRALHLPGHSPDGLALRIGGTVWCGDYLSPCEIPFVDDAAAYRATLARLGAELADATEVIPGHGPRLTAVEARAICDQDLAYLDRLLAARDATAAAAIPLPRAADVPGMRDHHAANGAKVLSAAAVR
ncbi:MAG: MBL fold metallo-hydrolase [Myxococcales bacterium]|nr:MBL fold metallo-hydrolase [Myxococcales bacterium]